MISKMDEDQESRTMNWREILDIVVRRRWWLAAPLLTLGLIGSIVAREWPEVYRSEALILVEQQKVPEQFVTPNVIANMQDRLQSMTQEILSRTRLISLINQFGLYRRERSHLTMDEVVDKMRENIHVELVQNPEDKGDLTAFHLSFSTQNPRVAQQVANELTSAFIEENLEDRAQQSINTTSFLESQLDEAGKNLADQEKQMSEYKSRFLGQLPEQEQSNLQILGSLEAQLEGANNELERAEQEKTYLESLRAGYKAAPQSTVVSPTTAPSGHYANPEEALRDLRAQLTDLQAKYKPAYPDIIKLKDQIAMWEIRSRNAKTAESPEHATHGAVAASLTPTMIDIDSRLKGVTAEVTNRRKDVAQIQGLLRSYQGRLNMTPVREQQLAEVTRNYENSRALYQSLLQKKEESELATNLEKRQEGERFRLIDPPTLPQKPVEPNRLEIVLAGWLSGLCLAVGLAATREFTDDTLRTEMDLSRSTPLPVLVRLPVILSPLEEKRKLRGRFLELAGASLLFALSVGAGIYTCLVI